MGCIVSKGYPQKRIDSSSQLPLEYEPISDGKKDKKKQIHERTLSARQCKVITDPILTSKYNIKSLIGVGTFSDVFFVEDKKTKLPYAIKYLELRSLKTKKVFQSESTVFNILKESSSISHPYIVKLNEVITSSFSAYIIMELATGGDLFERIHSKGHLEEKETKRVTAMILSAVAYLHSIGITHRDLKPENVLFYSPGANSRIMITDFGFASHHEPDSILNTYCGTLQYCSPELMLGDSYSSKADVWAVGVIVYFMLSGQLPFNADDVMSFRNKITRTPHSFKREIWKNISTSAKDFIGCLLAKKESERFSADQAVRHPWVATTNNTSKTSNYRRRNHGDNESKSQSSTHSHTRGIKREQEFISEFDKLPSVSNEEIEDLKDTYPLNISKKHPRFVNVGTCNLYNQEIQDPPYVVTESASPVTNSTIQKSRSAESLEAYKGTINNAYEQCIENKSDNATEVGNAMETMDTNGKQFIIPKRYYKTVLMEDLFNTDTSSSYSTCGASSNHTTQGTTYAESIADNSLELDKTRQVFENQMKTSRQFPPIFKRSLSNVPTSSHYYPDKHFHKRASLQFVNKCALSELFREPTVDTAKLDKLFSIKESKGSLTPVSKMKSWLESRDKSDDIEQWLTTVGSDRKPLPIPSSRRTNRSETISKSL